MFFFSISRMPGNTAFRLFIARETKQPPKLDTTHTRYTILLYYRTDGRPGLSSRMIVDGGNPSRNHRAGVIRRPLLGYLIICIETAELLSKSPYTEHSVFAESKTTLTHTHARIHKCIVIRNKWYFVWTSLFCSCAFADHNLSQLNGFPKLLCIQSRIEWPKQKGSGSLRHLWPYAG